MADHAHVVVFVRHRRSLPPVAECEICGEELVANVIGWAKERGLDAPVDGGPATVKDAIEQELNAGQDA